MADIELTRPEEGQLVISDTWMPEQGSALSRLVVDFDIMEATFMREEDDLILSFGNDSALVLSAFYETYSVGAPVFVVGGEEVEGWEFLSSFDPELAPNRLPERNADSSLYQTSANQGLALESTDDATGWAAGAIAVSETIGNWTLTADRQWNAVSDMRQENPGLNQPGQFPFSLEVQVWEQGLVEDDGTHMCTVMLPDGWLLLDYPLETPWGVLIMTEDGRGFTYTLRSAYDHGEDDMAVAEAFTIVVQGPDGSTHEINVPVTIADSVSTLEETDAPIFDGEAYTGVLALSFGADTNEGMGIIANGVEMAWDGTYWVALLDDGTLQLNPASGEYTFRSGGLLPDGGNITLVVRDSDGDTATLTLELPGAAQSLSLGELADFFELPAGTVPGFEVAEQVATSTAWPETEGSGQAVQPGLENDFDLLRSMLEVSQ